VQILKEIQLVSDMCVVPPEAMVFTYAPAEGLCIWWMKSYTSDIFKRANFVKETLECSHGWWVRLAFDSMDWSCSYIVDPDKVDLGPYDFKMTGHEFMEFYTKLWAAEYQESEKTVNVVGVDYASIFSKQANYERKPKTEWNTADGGFPVLDVDNAHRLISLSQLRTALFDGVQINDEARHKIIGRLLNNKEDLIRLLRNMK